MSDDLTISTTLAFDRDKQSAIVGWALRDKEFFAHAVNSIDPLWLADAYLGKVWAAVQSVFKEFRRRITPKELRSYHPFLQEDARSQELIFKAVEKAVAMTNSYGLDMLRREISGWMKSVIFFQGVQQAVQQYNAQKPDQAWKLIEEAVLKRRTASFEDGVNEGFKLSSERMSQERQDRLQETDKILPYGVRYYDEALGGLMPSDLVVVGAKTNKGKTGLVTNISHSIAMAGFPVFFYALEAEEFEIERRIKYPMISAQYYAQQAAAGNRDFPEISYRAWRQGRQEHLTGKIEDDLHDEFEKSVLNLHTLYRTAGDFNNNALEHSLMQCVDEARAIVIDHLHYVDADEDDENSAYKRVCKTVRKIVLRYKVPVILVAHLRKTQGGSKNASLLPHLEEFHGTSDVPKISTTCLMLSPADDQMHGEKHLWPTYLGAMKSRLDGSVTKYVGLVNFNQRTQRYEDSYTVGRLEDGGKVWEPVEPSKLPYWSESNVYIETATDSTLG